MQACIYNSIPIWKSLAAVTSSYNRSLFVVTEEKIVYAHNLNLQLLDLIGELFFNYHNNNKQTFFII